MHKCSGSEAWNKYLWNKIAKATFIKVVNGIDIDDFGNLEDLLKLVLIDKKCWNLKVVINGWGLARNINQKKTSDVLQAYIDLQFTLWQVL